MIWKTLLTTLLDYVFKKLPGIIDNYIIKPAKEAAETRRRNKEESAKIKNHDEAKTKKDKINTFNKLP